MIEIKQAVTEFVGKSLREMTHYASFEGHVIEVQDVTPTEFMVRAKPEAEGAPRYFRVKVSESI